MELVAPDTLPGTPSRPGQRRYPAHARGRPPQLPLSAPQSAQPDLSPIRELTAADTTVTAPQDAVREDHQARQTLFTAILEAERQIDADQPVEAAVPSTTAATFPALAA